MRRSATIILVAASLAAASFGIGHADDGEKVTPVFRHELPNSPGKSLVAFIVAYAPGGKSVAHHHAKSAFVYAQILTGSIRSKVGDEPEKIYKTGENFFEMPGSAHAVSENASRTEPASLLAVFIVDTKDKDLTVPDKH
ncbi:cupin domain-containing protein [Rhizobium ruizarguesonis]|jgi:quercetin dioxygenase-like cupin family protein|uniref:cupin domain-containing protein n=1 Tax=Rhizobium ruizarguesonis TaxID=2081791 RepID=UPI001032242C|nr:cupin domain-containing protein [Rhizobium ruizarguesonis]MBY5890870.1 cupin domain-containing protein [Rhizobium leguminosarum]NEH32228.1 cupin domain-containing protein [Rhizobium ruizarguesonis]NEI09836.1 cupin domain-containing protein [Rhizobium ruizarguesonis]NEJ09810.1 cupin domain-containing protein [Rhizobium ruizarguesonis]NEK12365.1 cupin domain-containing protein [Rhizobium ruizarguesonis]